MPLPTGSQITARQNAAQAKLVRLQTVYQKFMAEWAQIENEEASLVRQLSGLVDKTKLASVLQTIHSIKD